MSKIEINNVYKIFGNNPNSVLPMVKDGATKEQVLVALKEVAKLLSACIAAFNADASLRPPSLTKLLIVFLFLLFLDDCCARARAISYSPIFYPFLTVYFLTVPGIVTADDAYAPVCVLINVNVITCCTSSGDGANSITPLPVAGSAVTLTNLANGISC